MNKLRQKRSVLTAIFWAAVMIAVSLLLNDHEQRNTVIFLVIAAWVASGGISSGTQKAECRVSRRPTGKT